MTQGIERPLSDSDALLWKMGRDPVLRAPVVALVLLDKAPRWEPLRRRVGELMEWEPRLGSRIANGSLRAGGRPHWVAHRDFDLDVHLRRTAVAGSGTLRSVLDIAQVMGMTAFDPELPLWEAVVVEKLDGDMAAVIVKLHHAVVDGVGGLTLLARLFDSEPDGAGATNGSRKSESITTASVKPGNDPIRSLFSAARWVGRAGIEALTSPLDEARRVTDLAVSVGRLLAPAPRPISALMTGRGLRRRYEVLDVSSDLLRQAAQGTGSTVNDVFVTALLGGVRDYHVKHGSALSRLRVLMPINIRSQGDESGGNHFVPVRFPVSVAGHLAQQLDLVHQVTSAWKRSPALKFSSVLAAPLGLLPSGVTAALWGSLLKGDDVVATNVPGPPATTFLAGSRVEGLYAFAPTTGAALNAALITMDRRACIGVNIDTTAIDDPEVLVGCLDSALNEVLDLGSTSRGVT
jgi:diacylglycerol O-acyltransferase / wax synthase